MKPTSLVRPKNSWIRGLRRSQPDQDDLLAGGGDRVGEVRQTVVLPSAAAGEVMSSDFIGSSRDMNCSDVRSARKASAGGDFGCSAAIRSGVLRSSHSEISGISPIAGRPRGELLELGARADLVVERLAQQRDRDADGEAGEAAQAARRSSGFGETGVGFGSTGRRRASVTPGGLSNVQVATISVAAWRALVLAHELVERGDCVAVAERGHPSAVPIVRTCLPGSVRSAYCRTRGRRARRRPRWC